MLSIEDKRIANQQIEKLRRNPPRITKADWAASRKLFKEQQKKEAEKDRDIKSEIGALSKDLGAYVYNQIHGIDEIFHGIGEGKKVVCSFCEQHGSEMFNTNDGKWYCQEHRWFGNLTEKQKREEQLCLSTKRSS